MATFLTNPAIVALLAAVRSRRSTRPSPSLTGSKTLAFVKPIIQKARRGSPRLHGLVKEFGENPSPELFGIIGDAAEEEGHPFAPHLRSIPAMVAAHARADKLNQQTYRSHEAQQGDLENYRSMYRGLLDSSEEGQEHFESWNGPYDNKYRDAHGDKYAGTTVHAALVHNLLKTTKPHRSRTKPETTSTITVKEGPVVHKARPVSSVNPDLVSGFLNNPSSFGRGVLADHLEEIGHPHAGAMRDLDQLSEKRNDWRNYRTASRYKDSGTQAYHHMVLKDFENNRPSLFYQTDHETKDFYKDLIHGHGPFTPRSDQK